MRRMEQPSEEDLNEAADPAWAALSPDEQMEIDSARYFRVGWVKTYQDAARQIAEESGFDRWQERRRQSRRAAQQKLAGIALEYTHRPSATPKHRADSDI